MHILRLYEPRIIDGFIVTIKVTVYGICVAGFMAFLFGIARTSRARAIRLVAGGVVEFLRGTSVVVQLFWVFFALPLLPGHIQLPPMFAAVLVLGLNEGAYAAEVVRGAIVALPTGQSDAATALSLSPWVRVRHVLLPQAISMMMPGFGNAAIDLMKGSAFVSYVEVQDLTHWSTQIRQSTGDSLPAYGIALVGYFAFALFLSALFRLLERYTPMRRIRRSAAPRSGWPRRQHADTRIQKVSQ